MNYNVIGPDGSVYGPVDEATLKQWVTEARVLPTTLIEEVGSGRRVEARTIPSLFPSQQMSSPAAPSVLHAGYEPPKTSTTGVGQIPGGGVAGPSGAYVSATPGYTSATSGAPIENHLVKSILTTLCCCLPLGVVAIIFSAQVGSKQSAGDRLGAQEAADKAKLFGNIALGIGLVTNAILIGLYVVGFMAMKNAPTQFQQGQFQRGQNPFPNGFPQPGGMPGGNFRGGAPGQ